MSENQLIESKCVPCQGGIDPLSGKVVCELEHFKIAISQFLRRRGRGW